MSLDPAGIFAAQSQMAQQALTPTLLGGKGDHLASLLYRQPIVVPTAPQLQFGTNATGIGGGIVQGLGNAVNNTLQLRSYGQQQDRVKQYEQQQQHLADLSQQRDLAAAQQQQRDLAKQDTFLQTLPENVRPYYEQSDKEGRRKILYDLSQPGLGALVGQGKAAEAQASAQGLGDAAGTQKVAEIMRANKALTEAGVNINTPQGQNLFRAILGFDPTTQTDLDAKKTNNMKAGVDLRKAQNELGAQPQMIQNTLDKESLQLTEAMLNNEIKGVEAKFAEEEKKLKIQNDKRGMLDLTAGRDLFRQLRDTGKLGTNDPMEQAKIQAQLGVYGIKYNPPSSGYATIKNKDKSVWLLDKATGMVGALDKNGKVKRWQPLH